jgi:ectoine hydroxylase
MMRRLAADDRLAGVARFLLGDDVYIHQSRLNYKPGFLGKEFYWHSDFETWHVEDGMPRMRALSMSLLLAPNTQYNGPLMLIPGSHHRYLTCVGETPEDHHLNSLKKQEYGVPDEDSLTELVHAYGIVAPVGEPGTVVLFDCNVMHGSNGNITPFPRANAFFVYNALSNRLEAPFGLTKPRPSFLADRSFSPLLSPPGSLIEGVT